MFYDVEMIQILPFHYSVDCLINLDNGKSHVGRITAEEAFLGANLLSKNVVVLGEVKNRE